MISLPRPSTALSAYGRIIRRTENPRDIELRVFSQVTAALQVANTATATPVERVAAIHENRELWISLACGVADDANAMSDTLRAGIISLSIWVNRESARLLACLDPLTDLIDNNQTIMVGLVAQPAEAV